jgi:rare lipoprotein A
MRRYYRPHEIGLLPPVVVLVVAVVLVIGLAACSSGRGLGSRYDARTGVSASTRVVADGRPIPKGGGRYKVGAPYKVSGRWYVPQEDMNYDRTGVASWYGADFHGRLTANGEVFDMGALTAAHPTLPMPSYAYVTNLETGRTILVRINDRGPYANDRVIDLSRQAARFLGSEAQGLARVRVRYAGRAPLDGDDRQERMYLASQPWYGGRQDTRMAEGRPTYLRPMGIGAENLVK